MNVQIIETPQGERMAVLSERDYFALLDQAELQSDLAALDGRPFDGGRDRRRFLARHAVPI